MTGTMEPSYDGNGFWDTLGKPGYTEGAAFCPFFFFFFLNWVSAMVASTFSSSVPADCLLDF